MGAGLLAEDEFGGFRLDTSVFAGTAGAIVKMHRGRRDSTMELYTAETILRSKPIVDYACGDGNVIGCGDDADWMRTK
ncbi:hypothetical protein [Actinokineospora sp.]|uniref:hypothetical protein n=1 Tax=Actinokineospora sp. TaxID=1872133 RepID=UPI003D6C50F5